MKYLKIFEEHRMDILDMVIDNDGNIYSGEVPGFPLVKGYIKYGRGQNIDYIVGKDNRRYIAGIDKNGKMLSKRSDDGHIINDDGEKVRIPQNVRDIYNISGYWKVTDYPMTITKLPTGWVNVKVDMEVLKRVRRYSKNIGTNKGDTYKCLVRKLSDLNDMSGDRVGKHKKWSRTTIQREMSMIMLLHYINEIREFFSPSSAGFIFESFIAGLIPGSTVNSDNGKNDIVSGSKKYQIKLYSPGGNIPILTPTMKTSLSDLIDEDNNDGIKLLFCDYYVIGVKHPEKIDIYLLTNIKDDPNYVLNYMTPGFDLSINSMALLEEIYSINILNIEGNIETIASGLKESLDDMFGELSQFQYNLETIITGVDQKGKVLDGQEFTAVSNSANGNVTNMRDKLNKLIGRIHRTIS